MEVPVSDQDYADLNSIKKLLLPYIIKSANQESMRRWRVMVMYDQKFASSKIKVDKMWGIRVDAYDITTFFNAKWIKRPILAAENENNDLSIAGSGFALDFMKAIKDPATGLDNEQRTYTTAWILEQIKILFNPHLLNKALQKISPKLQKTLNMDPNDAQNQQDATALKEYALSADSPFNDAQKRELIQIFTQAGQLNVAPQAATVAASFTTSADGKHGILQGSPEEITTWARRSPDISKLISLVVRSPNLTIVPSLFGILENCHIDLSMTAIEPGNSLNKPMLRTLEQNGCQIDLP